MKTKDLIITASKEWSKEPDHIQTGILEEIRQTIDYLSQHLYLLGAGDTTLTEKAALYYLYLNCQIVYGRMECFNPDIQVPRGTPKKERKNK